MYGVGKPKKRRGKRGGGVKEKKLKRNGKKEGGEGAE